MIDVSCNVPQDDRRCIGVLLGKQSRRRQMTGSVETHILRCHDTIALSVQRSQFVPSLNAAT